MFQFRRFPSYDYEFIIGSAGLTLQRFPHSDIRGSRIICISPRLFAACHVLLRLPVPRHSPCALSNLTTSSLSLNYTRTSQSAFQHFYLLLAYSVSFSFQGAKYVDLLRVIPAGGDKRDRTVDLLLARQALSQLSYTPAYAGLRTLKIKQGKNETCSDRSSVPAFCRNGSP